ncbi:MAG: protein phosphatase 2C domain-containing protein [Pyrinomonadaceae bacterium]|jgi:protein phosphatase|nr:protein phosphatase 2C domain-containing protein [Pyrinomonadaceae bacterium]
MQQTRLFSSAVTDKGLSEKRPQNEDSYLEMPSKGLFAVADGVGGASSGEVASQMAVEVLAEAFGNHQEATLDIEELMKLAIKRANSAIYQMSSELAQMRTMATTVVALQISDNIATIGHVGDSRLYRLDSKGNLFRETQDHSVVEEEVRAGRMTVAQAANHPSRNVISRALGAESSVEIDMKTIMFEPNTIFLLCSDGITRHLSDIEIREMLLTCQNPVEVCREMKNLCYNRGAEDNLTAVVIKAESVWVDENADDEPTISNVRPNFANSFPPTQSFEQNEIPTRELQNSFKKEEEDYNQSKEFNNSSSQLSVPTNHSKDGAIFRVEGAGGAASDDDVRQYEQMQAERAYIIDHSRRESMFGRIFKALFLMAFGGILGIAGYYALTDYGKQQPIKTEQTVSQTPNLPYLTFEENRRNVDKDSRKYLETNGANAKDAEDFYLIGRANLNLLNYKQAIENFRKSKELLPNVSEINKKSLENELNVVLAMLADEDAVKRFEKERSVSQNTAVNAVTNTAVNTANVKSNSNSSVNTKANTNSSVNIKPITNTASNKASVSDN